MGVEEDQEFTVELNNYWLSLYIPIKVLIYLVYLTAFVITPPQGVIVFQALTLSTITLLTLLYGAVVYGLIKRTKLTFYLNFITLILEAGLLPFLTGFYEYPVTENILGGIGIFGILWFLVNSTYFIKRKFLFNS